MRRALLCAMVAIVLAWQAPARAQATFFTIQPSQVSGIAATTLTRNTVTLPLNTLELNILLNVTAGGTATGTLQIWLEDSVDGGTTWDDVISSLTFALGAAPVTQRFMVSGRILAQTITTAAATNVTQGSATTNETLAAGSARQGPFGVLWRVREKITVPSGSPVGATYTITAALKQ